MTVRRRSGHGEATAIHRAAERLRQDLHARGVLCDPSLPCNISTSDTNITICLPRVAAVLGSHVCEPWGEIWQQQGGPIGSFSSKPGQGCVSFDLTAVAAWWLQRRQRGPFIESIDEKEMKHLIKGKRFTPTQKAQMRRALAGWDSPSFRVGYHRPLMYKSCAFVGSGHDLRCGRPKGSEIDAHDAVFRANAAQAMAARRDHQADASIARGTQVDSSSHSIGAVQAGGRTDFRVNCLFNSTLIAAPTARTREICVISHGWWTRRAGREQWNNRGRPCCERELYSNYSLPNLERNAVHLHAQFRWMRRGPLSGVRAIDDMLLGSGGNALQSAVSLCRAVSVYGAGLLSESPTADKLYAHAYDTSVGGCLVSTAGFGFARWDNYKQYLLWLSSRIEAELLLHIFHALGVITWIQ